MLSWLEYLLDGQCVVTGSWSGTVQVWNLESGEQEGTSIKHKGEITGLVVSWNGTKIITSGCRGRVKVWDVESRKLVKEWTHLEIDPKIAILPDDRLVAVGHWNVAVYTMEGRHIDSIKTGSFIGCMCFSPDGNKLAYGTVSSICLYDVNSGTLIAVLSLDGDRLFDVLWSCDGSKLFASKGGTIQCWNSDTGQQIRAAWTGHTGNICSLSLSPDGLILASTSLDKTVHFWNATTGNPIGQHLQNDCEVTTVHFSPSSKFVASAGWNSNIQYIYGRW